MTPLRFTRREEQVIFGVCAGLSNKEIALFVESTEGAVAQVVRVICLKMGCSKRVGIATWVYSHMRQNPGSLTIE